MLVDRAQSEDYVYTKFVISVIVNNHKLDSRDLKLILAILLFSVTSSPALLHSTARPASFLRPLP